MPNFIEQLTAAKTPQWRVPETKNRNLEQIEREIHGDTQMVPRRERSRRRESPGRSARPGNPVAH